MCTVNISVVVTSFGFGHNIRRSIRSLQNQDMDPRAYEIVVVDDRSTDDSIEILGPFVSSGEIRLVTNRSNLGAVLDQALHQLPTNRSDTAPDENPAVVERPPTFLSLPMSEP
jgi:cellulose synthase/poly-beta-1,6-N-acetylglucosamine synthase-like glycosyltransferase